MIGFWGRATSIEGTILTLAPVVMDKTCEMNPFDPLFDPNAPVDPNEPEEPGVIAAKGGGLLSVILISIGILLASCTVIGLLVGVILVCINKRKEKLSVVP